MMSENKIPFDGEVYLFENFFSESESVKLFEALQTSVEWKQDEIKMFGKGILLPRLTAWYGDEGKVYTYSGIKNKPLKWTKELAYIRQCIEARSGEKYNSALLNLYRDEKDSMGWHSDDEKELGVNPVIASLSLGASRVFQLKHKVKKIKTSFTLHKGSLLIMKGKTQHCWLHRVPKTSASILPRINITFRLIN